MLETRDVVTVLTPRLLCAPSVCQRDHSSLYWEQYHFLRQQCNIRCSTNFLNKVTLSLYLKCWDYNSKWFPAPSPHSTSPPPSTSKECCDLGSGIWEVGAKKALILCVLLRRLPPTVPYSLVSLALVTSIIIIVVYIYFIAFVIFDTIMNNFYWLNKTTFCLQNMGRLLYHFHHLHHHQNGKDHNHHHYHHYLHLFHQIYIIINNHLSLNTTSFCLQKRGGSF